MMLETLQQRTYRIAREIERAENEFHKTEDILTIQRQLVAALDELQTLAREAFVAHLAEEEKEQEA
jgi:hypothetical protein